MVFMCPQSLKEFLIHKWKRQQREDITQSMLALMTIQSTLVVFWEHLTSLQWGAINRDQGASLR